LAGTFSDNLIIQKLKAKIRRRIAPETIPLKHHFWQASFEEKNFPALILDKPAE
jgi:hypothetical protein